MRKELIIAIMVVMISMTSIAVAAGSWGHHGQGQGPDEEVITIEIDVKPNSGGNTPTTPTINISAGGCLPILVYGSVDFNVDDIDMGTLKINGEPATARIIGSGTDENNDDYEDVLLDFDVIELVANGALVDGQVTLLLEGELLNGDAFEGSDNVYVIA